MAYALMPDVDQALVTFLDTHPALVPLHGGRVATSLPSGTAPVVRVTPLGGTSPWPWESTAEYQVEWWGGTQKEAKDLARAGEAALWDFLGPITGGRITGVTVALSQLWSPDETTARPRFLTQVSFNVYPEEA